MRGNVSFANVFKFAGAYCACAIGSGFATGQEIMQFFTAQGLMGIAGAVVTMLVFGWAGGTVMKDANKLQLKEPGKIAEYYFGKKAGNVFSVISKLFLFGVFVIMIAGAGATLSEYYGLSPLTGRLLMLGLAGISVILSLDKITDILGKMGIIIIFLAVAVGLISFLKHPGQIASASEFIAESNMTGTRGGWLVSSVLYPAFNMVVCLFFTAGIGKKANSGKEAFLGGMVGGILFGLAVLVMNLGITANIWQVFDKQIPSLVLASNITPILAPIFTVIIVCGIYTTAVPMLWSTASMFGEKGTRKYTTGVILLCVLAFVLAMTDFKVLINLIYPFSGYAGILLMVVMLIRSFRELRKNVCIQIPVL